MSTGTVSTSNAPGGAYDPTRTNFYCGGCNRFVQAPPGAVSMRECPTPGCPRPTGFGELANVLRPRELPHPRH